MHVVNKIRKVAINESMGSVTTLTNNEIKDTGISFL